MKEEQIERVTILTILKELKTHCDGKPSIPMDKVLDDAEKAILRMSLEDFPRKAPNGYKSQFTLIKPFIEKRISFLEEKELNEKGERI
jgi:hypothetical protein